MKDAVLAAAKQYEALGAVVEEASLPALEYPCPPTMSFPRRASSNLARFDGAEIRLAGHEDYENIHGARSHPHPGLSAKRRSAESCWAASSPAPAITTLTIKRPFRCAL